MKFTVTQTVPSGHASLSVVTRDAREARDVVVCMVERGAKEVEVVDAGGSYYDLIDLEYALDDESL